MKNNYDFIIVGQGLAGTLMAERLMEADKTVLVIDNFHRHAASQVAAGIINPITGKRIVKSWLIEELLKNAFVTYQNLEKKLGIPIIGSKQILRVLQDAADENEWISRSVREEFERFVVQKIDLAGWENIVHRGFSYAEIVGARVHLGDLITEYRHFLKKRYILLEEEFLFSELKVDKNLVFYKNITASGIIFCEGQLARFNPFFSYLPFQANKGEALMVRIPNFRNDKIYKKNNILLVRQKNDVYWVGANNERDSPDDLPTPKGRQELDAALQEMLSEPYEIIEHRAAIRPTTKQRRPFLGSHSKHSNLFIFNGLGTKGAALAPFFSRQLADFILYQTPMHELVDIRKYDL